LSNRLSRIKCLNLQLTNEASIHLKDFIYGRAQVDVIIANGDDFEERNLRALQNHLVEVLDGAHFQIVDLPDNQTCCTVPRFLPLFAREPILVLFPIVTLHDFHDFRIPGPLDEGRVVGEIFLGEVANVVYAHLAHLAILSKVVENQRKVDVGVVMNAADERVENHQVRFNLLAILQIVVVILSAPEALKLEINSGRHEIIRQWLKQFIHAVSLHQSVVFLMNFRHVLAHNRWVLVTQPLLGEADDFMLGGFEHFRDRSVPRIKAKFLDVNSGRHERVWREFIIIIVLLGLSAQLKLSLKRIFCDLCAAYENISFSPSQRSAPTGFVGDIF
jgi:hypothetical protein